MCVCVCVCVCVCERERERERERDLTKVSLENVGGLLPHIITAPPTLMNILDPPPTTTRLDLNKCMRH